jgi:hypothetical protein
MPIGDCDFWPDTETTVDPGTDTETGDSTFPSTGVNPQPNATAAPGGPAFGDDPDDATGNSCMGAAWSWNPVNWVYVPIKCALIWAFVPSPETWSALSDLRDELVERPPGSVVVAIGSAAGGSFDGYTASCAEMPNFGTEESPVQLPCAPAVGSGGSVVYGLVSLAIGAAGLFRIWAMGLQALKAGGGE